MLIALAGGGGLARSEVIRDILREWAKEMEQAGVSCEIVLDSDGRQGYVIGSSNILNRVHRVCVGQVAQRKIDQSIDFVPE